MSQNFLFGPFIGETIYELNYFVGHAIFLRKQDPKNKIIVLTRKENFDLYGKYATTLINLPLSDELKPDGFGCNNVYPSVFDEIVRKFKNNIHRKMRVHGHFYPQLNTYLKDLKWYYPRKEVDFDFKPRTKNKLVAKDIMQNRRRVIISDFLDDFKKVASHFIVPNKYFFEDMNIEGIVDITKLGILIETIRLARFIHADIDSILGRLAMLMSKPLITQRDFLDARYLNPINPYGSIVIGCGDLIEGIKYLEGTQ